MTTSFEAMVALAKRRSFIFPSSEIYGGLANTYDYGPLGTQLKRTIQDLWWQRFINQRGDMVGLDSSIILHPKVWEASGHVSSFADALVDCRKCQYRKRADHLIEEFAEAQGEEIKVEGLSESALDTIIAEKKIPCPNCGEHSWTKVRRFNLLFETNIGIVPESQSKAYLRGETAQGIFVNFKTIVATNRVKLPFGVGQLGKSFRNEITLGNSVFRTLEFEQGEIEYFFDPENTDRGQLFEEWKNAMWSFVTGDLGISPERLRWRPHTDEERSHYSSRTEDLEYLFPFGWKELWGLADRGEYDLKQHQTHSGQDLTWNDPETGRKFLPHVIEPAVGINRLLLMVMCEHYSEDTEKPRTVLSLPAKLAPIQVAVFPLLRNKPELLAKAREIEGLLRQSFRVAWDDRGNIGKRYLSQDEVGTPFCVTIDFDTLENNTVTVRERDSMTQETISLDELVGHLQKYVNSR